MKIITRLVLDLGTLSVLHEESINYTGPVAQCGGGGFGKSQPSVSVPAAEETPSYESEKEPVSQSVRDAEAAKLRQRRGLAGTILTSPLGTTGSGSNLLGA